MSATIIIETMLPIFATYGIPGHVFADNDGTFRSEEWKKIMTQNGIRHITTAFFHFFSNGEAEIFVQTFKNNFKEN